MCIGGRCGVCGDAYSGVRYHEIGGKYATNIIVRTYVSGALIDVKILVRFRRKKIEYFFCLIDSLIVICKSQRFYGISSLSRIESFN